MQQQQRNSSKNKLHPEDRSAHDWYRFVLSFPPHLVRDYLAKFDITASHRVLDPFCGTGTTIVECKKQNIPSVGVEANKLAQFAGATKIDWMIDPDILLHISHQVARDVLQELERQGVDDNPLFQDWCQQRNLSSVDLRTLDPDITKLLVKNSISPLPLHKVLVLRDYLSRHEGEPYYSHQMLALAKALIASISNLYFAPEVGVGALKDDASVVSSWLSQVSHMATDIRQLRLMRDIPATIYHADARNQLYFIEPQSIDAVITSPPYPNEKDYTRITRLESVLLGFIKSKADLQLLKRNLICSNTRSVYKDDDDDKWVMQYPEILRIAEEIETRRTELGKTSGFERLYSRVTKLYFGGMVRHLANLRTILRDGAQLAYVVGEQASYLRVMIQTGQLLADIAESLGYEVMGIDLFRTRLATSTKAQLREEVVCLRWAGGRKSLKS
ncbi:DNA methyltransferase [bacterium]|nr:DNA methyltransferase [bacterium]